jgi:hypothetical protein
LELRHSRKSSLGERGCRGLSTLGDAERARLLEGTGMGNSCPVRSGGMKIHTKRKFGIVPKGRNACVEEEGVPSQNAGEGKATPVSRDPASHHLRNRIRSHPESSHTSAPTGEKMEWYWVRGLPSAWDKTQLDSILPGHMAAMAPRLYSPYSQP